MSSIRPLYVSAMGVLVFLVGFCARAEACDQFAGRLISSALSPAVAGLGCDGVGGIGLDESEHRLESVCYASDGATSRLEIVAFLRCKTSDGAFIQASVSDRVHGRATVRGSDCQLLDVDVSASGDIGDLLVRAFDVNGTVRQKLQEALDDVCQ